AVHALGQEAVRLRLEVEHQVAADLAARVAEVTGEQAEARRFDRAGREDESAGGGSLLRALGVDGPYAGHRPSAGHQLDRLCLVAQLALPREERAAQRGHRWCALRVVGAPEAAAQPAVDAGWAPVVGEARGDGRRVGVGMERTAQEAG